LDDASVVKLTQATRRVVSPVPHSAEHGRQTSDIHRVRLQGICAHAFVSSGLVLASHWSSPTIAPEAVFWQ